MFKDSGTESVFSFDHRSFIKDPGKIETTNDQRNWASVFESSGYLMILNIHIAGHEDEDLLTGDDPDSPAPCWCGLKRGTRRKEFFSWNRLPQTPAYAKLQGFHRVIQA